MLVKGVALSSSGATGLLAPMLSSVACGAPFSTDTTL